MENTQTISKSPKLKLDFKDSNMQQEEEKLQLQKFG